MSKHTPQPLLRCAMKAALAVNKATAELSRLRVLAVYYDLFAVVQKVDEIGFKLNAADEELTRIYANLPMVVKGRAVT